jgi:maleate isomerase
LSFGEELEARVARIDPKSIQAAALEIGRDPEVDAVFLSCTNLRTMDIIDALEDELGKPVVSSNQALAWHMAQLAGLTAGPNAPGKLFRL